MKKTILFAIILTLCLAFTVSAQVKTYGVTQAGSLLTTGGKSTFGFFVGANTPFVTDTVKHYTAYNRTGYFYSKTPGQDVQSISSFVINEKWFDVSKVTFHAGLGAGILQQVRDDGDKTLAGFKLELGATLWKSLTLTLGGDYYPRGDGPDEGFVYAGLDLLPN